MKQIWTLPWVQIVQTWNGLRLLSLGIFKSTQIINNFLSELLIMCAAKILSRNSNDWQHYRLKHWVSKWGSSTLCFSQMDSLCLHGCHIGFCRGCWCIAYWVGKGSILHIASSKEVWLHGVPYCCQMGSGSTGCFRCPAWAPGLSW